MYKVFQNFWCLRMFTSRNRKLAEAHVSYCHGPLFTALAIGRNLIRQLFTSTMNVIRKTAVLSLLFISFPFWI